MKQHQNKICHCTKRGWVNPTNINLQPDKTMSCQRPPITAAEPPHKTGHNHTRPPETQAGERLPDPNRARTEKHTILLTQKSRHHLPTKRRQTIHNKATPFMLRQQYSSPQTEECTHRRTTATERATLHKRQNIFIHHEVIPAAEGG